MGRAKKMAQQDALRQKNEPAVKSEWKELVERCIVISKDHAPQSQGAAFVVMDSLKKIKAQDHSGLLGAGLYDPATCKGNVVCEDGTDAALFDPEERYGSWGGCYEVCGCCLCDWNMILGGRFITGRIHILGAVPLMVGGYVGALAGSCDETTNASTEKKIIVDALESLGYKQINGVWINGKWAKKIGPKPSDDGMTRA